MGHNDDEKVVPIRSHLSRRVYDESGVVWSMTEQLIGMVGVIELVAIARAMLQDKPEMRPFPSVEPTESGNQRAADILDLAVAQLFDLEDELVLGNKGTGE